MEKKDLKGDDQIKSLEKCVNLLTCLSTEKRPLNLEELTQKSGYKKTTCFRLLKTMCRLGLAEQDAASKTYQLGPKLVMLGLTALKGMTLRKAALPVMEKLRRETGETINLSVLSGTEIVFIERLMSDYLVNANINIGDRLPLYCASMGKAILAFMSEERADEIISRLKLEAKTDRTLVSAPALKEELVQIRAKGFAINNEELEKGLRAVAAPIINYSGEAFAAINIAFATARHPGQHVFSEFARKVMAGAERISLLMGHCR